MNQAAGSPSFTTGRMVFCVVNLVAIPPVLGSSALILLLGTAACGNICDMVAYIWMAAAILVGVQAAIWLWTLVAVIRRRSSTALLVALAAVDATLIAMLMSILLFLR